jgi:putative redox protein
MKPPMVAELVWQRDLVFDARSGSQGLLMDGDTKDGVSPVQALAFALSACMSADVVHVLKRGRHALEGLQTKFVGQRAQEDPHRLTHVELTFHVSGNVPLAAIERAISLSHEKYCSVWHSMRQDIELVTRVVTEASPASNTPEERR